MLLDLVATNPDGIQVCRLPLRFTTRLDGSVGATTVGTDMSGTVSVHLQMTYQIPVPEKVQDGWQARVGQLKLGWVGPAGYLPSTLRPMAELVKACTVDGASLSVFHGRRRLVEIPAAPVAEFARSADLVLLLDDLQEHLGISTPIPDNLTDPDVHTLTMAWSVLSTGQGEWPYVVYRIPMDADGAGDFIKHPFWAGEPDDPGELVVRDPNLVVECAGMRLVLGPAKIRFPRVEIQNRAEVQAAAQAGSDVTVRLASADGATPVVSSHSAAEEPAA